MSCWTEAHHRNRQSSEVLEQQERIIIKGYEDHWSNEVVNTPPVNIRILI